MILTLYRKAFALFIRIPEKIRFLLVGGFNTVLGYAIFSSLHFFLGHLMHYSVVLLMQFAIGVNISYFTMKIFVFQTKGNYKREYPKVVSSYVGLYFVNLALLFILVGIAPSVYVAQFIAVCVATIIIYIMHKYVNYVSR